MNYVTRKGKFDAAHRVLDENIQCYNLHGHEYHYELTFSYKQTKKIGYPIDFKDIKAIGCKWITLNFDHAYIANPQDIEMIEICRKIDSNFYIMHLVDNRNYCNPTAENIAKEIFYAISSLIHEHETGLTLCKVKLFETCNCFVECNGLTKEETNLFLKSKLHDEITKYKRSVYE